MDSKMGRYLVSISAVTLLCLSAVDATLTRAGSDADVPSTSGFSDASKTASVAPTSPLELEEPVWTRLKDVSLDPVDAMSVQSAIDLGAFDTVSNGSDTHGPDRIEEQDPERTRREREAHIREAVEIAFVPLATESALLLVRGPTLGNCADTHMVILGPRDAAGQRVAERWPCTYEVLLRRMPSGAAPDLVFPRAGFAFEVYRWQDGHLAFVETLIDDVNSTGHSPCGGATAAGGDEIAGNFDCYVSVTIGSFDLRSIIQEPAIRARLRVGFGERYLTFLKNLTVRSPWRLVGGCLSMKGIAPHSGGDEEAALALCPGQNVVYAAMLTDGKLFLIAPRTAPTNLPLPIHDFLGDALDEAAVARRSLTWVE